MARIVTAKPWMAVPIAELQGRYLPEAPWTTAEVRDFLAEPTSLVFAAADEGLSIDGFVLCRHACEEAEILSIVVADCCQRTRLGTGLLIRALTAVRRRGGKRVFLEVSPRNEPALALYRKLGFTQFSVRKDYYRRSHGNWEDAFTLTKSLVPRAAKEGRPTHFSEK